MALAKSSAAVEGALGPGIHVRSFPIGSALKAYGSDFAEWSVHIAGSHGSGRLYGVANLLDGRWEFARLAVFPDDGSARIDLTPQPEPLSIRQPAVKTVYLLPIDLDRNQSLDWAPPYYKTLFQADVRVLPALTLTSLEIDPARHQAIAERCIERMIRAHRDLAADPSTVLLGVTSRDMYISAYDWRYAENLRTGSRFGIVSGARLAPTDFPGQWNRELWPSRLQKMISKNLAILYFGLPLSDDYTSLLSAGVLSGKEVDYMTERIVGSEHHWDSFFSDNDPMVTVTTMPGKPATWNFSGMGPSTGLDTEDLTADLGNGLFIQQKTNFYFDDEYPLEFVRVYRNSDEQSRAFGVGANDSLDVFLVGQMGSFADLIDAGGGRSHFVHTTVPGEPGDVYRSDAAFYTEVVYDQGMWRVTSRDGWTRLFPYRPEFGGAHVTVLTGMIDPRGNRYDMVRNGVGDLLSVTTPSKNWLHFEYGEGHRIRSIADSSGRSMTYEYDKVGRLTRATRAGGASESYTYDDKNAMLSITDGNGKRVMTNEYTPSSFVKRETFEDGRHIEFGYVFGPRMLLQQSFFVDPGGFYTYFDYSPGRYGTSGYWQSLPSIPSQSH